jgi:outer membrane protein assembly factor BamB
VLWRGVLVNAVVRVWTRRVVAAQVASDDGNLYCLGASSGKPLWQFTMGSQAAGIAIGTDGRVYMGAADSNVYAVKGANSI